MKKVFRDVIFFFQVEVYLYTHTLVSVNYIYHIMIFVGGYSSDLKGKGRLVLEIIAMVLWAGGGGGGMLRTSCEFVWVENCLANSLTDGKRFRISTSGCFLSDQDSTRTRFGFLGVSSWVVIIFGRPFCVMLSPFGVYFGLTPFWKNGSSVTMQMVKRKNVLRLCKRWHVAKVVVKNDEGGGEKMLYYLHTFGIFWYNFT